MVIHRSYDDEDDESVEELVPMKDPHENNKTCPVLDDDEEMIGDKVDIQNTVIPKAQSHKTKNIFGFNACILSSKALWMFCGRGGKKLWICT